MLKRANYEFESRGGMPTLTTILYLHDLHDHTIAELNASGQTLKEYIWLNDLPVAVVDGVGTAHKSPATPGRIVRDSSTGRMVEVRGYGALKGQLSIAEGVDLTKPIYDQVKKRSGRAAPKVP